jgi:hypothetical protein
MTSKSFLDKLNVVALRFSSGGRKPEQLDYLETELDLGNQTELEAGYRSQFQPLLVGFEGAAYSGYVIHNLTARVTQDIGLVQSVGNKNMRQHLDYARMANERNLPIISLGFSWGCGRAMAFAHRCQKEAIPIDLMIYMDPTYLGLSPFPKKIPSNVGRTIAFKSDRTIEIVGGRGLQREDFEDPRSYFENILVEETEHPMLPKRDSVEERIRREILEIFKKPEYF